MSEFKVEVPNEEMSFENLLGLDLDNEVGTEDLGEDVREEVIKVEEPHFTASLAVFNKALQMSSAVSDGSGKEEIAKSISMQVVDGKLKVMLTDFEVFLDRSLEILNKENILGDMITVKYDILSKIVKACKKTVTILKKVVVENEVEKTKYFIRLPVGDVELDISNVSRDKVVMDVSGFKEVGLVDNKEFRDVLKGLFDVANCGITAQEKRVYFKGGKAAVMYMQSTVVCDMVGMPDVDLKVKDCKILYSVTNNPEVINIKVLQKDNRVAFVGEGFMYTFLKSKNEIPQKRLEDVSSILSSAGKNIDIDELISIVDLSVGLFYTWYKLDLNYVDSGLKVVMKTKKTDSNFVLAGSGDVAPLSKDYTVMSTVLKVMLKSFKGKGSVDLIVTPKGFGIVSDKYKGVYVSTSE